MNTGKGIPLLLAGAIFCGLRFSANKWPESYAAVFVHKLDSSILFNVLFCIFLALLLICFQLVWKNWNHRRSAALIAADRAPVMDK